MKKQLTKLIDLKSVITMLLTGTLIFIVLRDGLSDEAVKTVFISTLSSVFTYYFTKKQTDKSDEA